MASLYDADMTKLGPATAEQAAAADEAEGGWIWIDADGDPIHADHEVRADDSDRDYTPVVRGKLRTDLRKVCVA